MDTYFVILEFHLQAGFEDAVVGTDAHDDDTRTLVVVALTENPLCASGGRLHDLLGGISGSEKPFFGH